MRRPAGLQAKLAVGAVDDPLEHEADRVAARVMGLPASPLAVTAAPPAISRKCAACDEEETLQKKSAGPAESVPADAPAGVAEVLRQPGAPLDAASRAWFEPRFGHDFGAVRIHADAAAAQSARAVNALAYTVGRQRSCSAASSARHQLATGARAAGARAHPCGAAD